MGVLQEVSGISNTIEAGIHLPCPPAPPFFVEDVISTTPDEINLLVPVQESPVVRRLRSGIAIAVTIVITILISIKRNGQGKTAISNPKKSDLPW